MELTVENLNVPVSVYESLEISMWLLDKFYREVEWVPSMIRLLFHLSVKCVFTAGRDWISYFILTICFFLSRYGHEMSTHGITFQKLLVIFHQQQRNYDIMQAFTDCKPDVFLSWNNTQTYWWFFYFLLLSTSLNQIDQLITFHDMSLC